jgi:hypothetical protein
VAQPNLVRHINERESSWLKKKFPLITTSAIIAAQPYPAALSLQPALPSETNLDWGFGLNRTRAALDELKKRGPAKP